MENYSLKAFVRRLRNSLSHNRISIESSESNYIIFKDYEKAANAEFEVVYHIEELHKFIFRFARFFLSDEWQKLNEIR